MFSVPPGADCLPVTSSDDWRRVQLTCNLAVYRPFQDTGAPAYAMFLFRDYRNPMSCAKRWAAEP